MKVEEGIVVAVFPERSTLRVQRTESDGMISAELNTITDTLPVVGQQVLCVFPSGSTRGYVLGVIFRG